MMNYELIEKYAPRTISSNAFYAIVAAALEKRQSLSVVRMADGERQLFEDCAKASKEAREHDEVGTFSEKWLGNMGMDGMTYHQLYTHMVNAIVNTDWFSPSVSGLTHPSYDMYKWLHEVAPGRHTLFPDNFFVNQWLVEQQTHLYKSAGKMLCIHRNPVTANCLAKRADQFLGVEVRHIPMSHWTQAEATVATAGEHADCPLVLASCGPASKWIIPQIARQGKVVLDVGNGMDHFLLLKLQLAANEAK